jgi:hypothetical protein
MNRLPEIGERVRYTNERFPDRTTTGTVVKLYEGFHPESLAIIRVGSPGWAERWSACVEIDSAPPWWAYGGDNRFAPSIAELEPLER